MTMWPDKDLEVEPTAVQSAADCPACGGIVALDEDYVVGEILYCEHCGMELELISTDPTRLELFEEEEK